MKKIKYIIVILIALTTTFGCIEDEILEIETTEIEGSAVVLNEIMSNDVGDGIDWIELYNKGTETFDLSGYILNDAKDPSGGWAIPDGTTLEAGGYIVFDENDWDFGGISSGGEWVSFADAAGTLIENVEVPSMASNAGLTYAKEIDGGDVWVVASATKGAMNGNVENTAPILGAEELTEHDRIYSVTASDADGIASVKLVYMVNDGVLSLEMSLVDGEYKTSVAAANVGDVVKYYVIATDKTGLTTVYPEGGTETPNEFTVIGGIEELTFSEVKPDPAIDAYDFSFTAQVYYPDQVDEVKVYYLLPGELQDDANDDKHSEVLSDLGDGVYKGTASGFAEGTELKYYLRVEYIDGTKTYYPLEEDGSDFNHDYGTTWPTVTVGDLPEIPVNGFSGLTITNVAAADLEFDVNIEYENGIEEVKFYYIINYDAATYVEDNDRHDIEWSGNLPTTDNMYHFSIPISELTSGDEISWYMRAKDGNGDKMYYTYGKTADEFDGDIKDDPATWHVVTKN